MMEWINSIITVIAVIIAATITEMVIHGFLVIVTYHHRYRTWRSSLLRTISWASFGKVRTVRTFILILPVSHPPIVTYWQGNACQFVWLTSIQRCAYIYTWGLLESYFFTSHHTLVDTFLDMIPYVSHFLLLLYNISHLYTYSLANAFLLQ